MILSISPENVTRLPIMKDRLRHCIAALSIIEQLPSYGDKKRKDRGIDDFFTEILRLDIDVDDRSSGDIRYREFAVNDKEEGFDVSVKVIQTHRSILIIINARFID